MCITGNIWAPKADIILPIGQVVKEPIPEKVKKSAAINNVKNTDFYITMKWKPPVVEEMPTKERKKIDVYLILKMEL